MSMIVCECCSAFIDSDDDPDCFIVLGAKDAVICQPCRERLWRECEEINDMNDDYAKGVSP